jgi:single-stranded DNA-binding protein
MNQVLISGSIVGPVMSKTLNDGRVVVNAVVCVEGFKPKDGPARFDNVHISAWGDAAKALLACAAGVRVFVSGRVSVKEGRRQDGTPSAFTDIVANSVERLASSGADTTPQPTAQRQPGNDYEEIAAAAPTAAAAVGDEIPF